MVAPPEHGQRRSAAASERCTAGIQRRNRTAAHICTVTPVLQAHTSSPSLPESSAQLVQHIEEESAVQGLAKFRWIKGCYSSWSPVGNWCSTFIIQRLYNSDQDASSAGAHRLQLFLDVYRCLNLKPMMWPANRVVGDFTDWWATHCHHPTLTTKSTINTCEEEHKFSRADWEVTGNIHAYQSQPVTLQTPWRWWLGWLQYEMMLWLQTGLFHPYRILVLCGVQCHLKGRLSRLNVSGWGFVINLSCREQMIRCM